MDYKQTINGFEQTFDMMCNNFYVEYPRLVAEAPTALQGLYKAEDYPDIDTVKTKFGFRRAVKPVPEAGDFRLDIPAYDLEEMKAEFITQQQTKLAEAMREPWDRLHKMLVGMSEKLTDLEGDDAKKRYHDTLITNPIELCSLLTKLNVTNDPVLEAARRQVELTMMGADIESIVLAARRKGLERAADAGAPNPDTISADDLKAALDDFMPSAQGLEKEMQEIAAVLECTEKRFLPERWKEQVSKPGGRSRLQERLAAIREVVGS
jgi:hypothetical protein